jgi:hypothetical protein
MSEAMEEPDLAIRVRVASLFEPLYGDIQPLTQLAESRLLFAHYTSLEALESIIRSNEIWFSNPLFMNDLDEIRFGVFNGATIARNNAAIKAALSEGQYHLFMSAFDFYFNEFDEKHAFDTYVFSASEHNLAQTDGKLSMWRGYGGNGKGAALVFDAAKLNVSSKPTPLVMSKVFYGSISERNERLFQYCNQMAALLTANALPDNHLYLAAHTFFNRLKLFALFTKHKGFEEELEWRIVYRPELDTEKKFDPMFGYTMGLFGVEPKLKLKIAPLAGVLAEDLSLEKIVHSLLLGPTTSSNLARNSVRRMLVLLGRPELAERIIASTIPLRAR